MNVLLVLTNAPDRQTADSLAAEIVERRLAACVNILSPCHSVYRWKGVVECADEVPMLIKTTEARYAALEELVRARHPYETPELVALPVTHGLHDYLAWVAAGRFDGFWEAGLSYWDVAAGILLVREAGGFVTDYRGGDAIVARREIVAGNGNIQSKLHRLVAGALR